MTDEQQILIDRMVDGELSTEQQHGVLADCEERAEWRSLALAYVESQILTKELKALASEVPLPHGHPVGNKEAVASSWNPLSLAVAIVLSLSLGWGLGWWRQDVPTHVEIGGDALAQSRESDPSREDSSNGRSSMQFTLSNPTTSELQQIDLPIVNASELGPDWQKRLRPTLPEDLLQEMRAGGLNVRQTRTVTPVRLPDGRRVFVPIDYYFEQPYQ